jgi:hypothetical protein
MHHGMVLQICLRAFHKYISKPSVTIDDDWVLLVTPQHTLLIWTGCKVV